MLKLFLSTYGLVFLAELPDKTALATLLMASRWRPWAVFWGVAAAFVVQSAVAVTFGKLISLLPARPVHITVALLFLGFAVWMWISHDEEPEEGQKPPPLSFGRTIWASFSIIFLAEWGDLTQLATAALVARYGNPWIILLAATTALWTVTALFVFIGQALSGRLHPKIIQRVGAILFAVLGLYMLWDTLGR